MRLAGQVSGIEDMRNAYKTLSDEPERKRPLIRPSHIWENNLNKLYMRVWVRFI
jgi:hypothetical protein